jgi:prevent-host-death family protein
MCYIFTLCVTFGQWFDFIVIVNEKESIMKQLNIREARQSLSQLEKLLAEEGEITITRRGEPIARVVPISPLRKIPSPQDLRQKMPRMKKGSEALIRAERDLQ